MLCILQCSAQNMNDASAYLGYIGLQFKEVSESMMSYSSAAAHGKGARKVEKRRQELLQQVKEAERNVRRMKPFQGDTKLRDSVVSFFDMSFHVLNEDYGKILNMEDIAEQSYDLMEAYMLAKERADQKLDEAGDRASEQYRAFAAANSIKLIEGDSKLSEKMKTVGKVNSYYKQLYLLFFKSYKDEAYFMEALSKGDLSAMEQSIASLKTSSTEGLAKLIQIPAYQGDGSMRNSCQELLRFFQRESNEYFPQFVDFELKKENMKKMQKALEVKKQNERTQKDIDTYNAVINDFNRTAAKINAMGAESNKTRNALTATWNRRTDEFFDKYTPRHR